MPTDLNFGYHDPTPKTLWTPDRDVAIGDSTHTTTAIHPAEMKVIEAMHTIAQRHKIVLACEKCRRPFQGRNSPNGQTQSVACGCRTLQATVRKSAIVGV